MIDMLTDSKTETFVSQIAAYQEKCEGYRKTVKELSETFNGFIV